jgi:hypothetical protein
VVDTWSQAQLWTRPLEDAVSPDGEDRRPAAEAVTHLTATEHWSEGHITALCICLTDADVRSILRDASGDPSVIQEGE